jgi:predicted NUDIX family phosphoesterase
VSHPQTQTHTERVLVVPAAEFDRLGRFQGFCGEAERYLEGLLVPNLAQFRPRSDVEDDPSLKQIIPYVIFRAGELIFCYTRGKSQGEARLHRLRSLGVGGHVAEADAGGGATLEAYEMALRRELDEEVAIESDGAIRRIGLINDDSNPVGRVHLGVVHLYDLAAPAVTPREDGLAEAEFLPLDRVLDLRPQFETWSQICIDWVLRPEHKSQITNPKSQANAK